jgi:hypothetical protein
LSKQASEECQANLAICIAFHRCAPRRHAHELDRPGCTGIAIAHVDERKRLDRHEFDANHGAGDLSH